MNERERLIELMTKAENSELSLLESEKKILADCLLENGVIVLPFSIGQLIDTVFSHNSRVCITVEDEHDNHFSKSIFTGMGWEIPDTIKTMKCKRIYACIPESISDSDVLHIEAEKALKGGATNE